MMRTKVRFAYSSSTCMHIYTYMYVYTLHPIDEVDANEDVEPVDNSPWADSDRDYAYEEVSVAVLYTPHAIYV